MKKALALLLVLAMGLGLAACGQNSNQKEEENKTPEPVFEGADINIGVLAGPTGIGAVALMEENDAEKTVNHYNFTVASANDEITAGLISKDLDIAAVATNLASALYKKTEGELQICALNTYGVLYIIENGNEIQSVADLKGKKIYATGQGANPEYVLEYILSENGLSYSTDGSEADVQIEFMDSQALVAGAVQGNFGICMLPVPAVTSVMVQNKEMRNALDLTEEWNKVADEGVLTMGCVVVRKEFAEANPQAVAKFLEEYSASINSVKSDIDHAAQLCEQYGIVAKAAIAKKAIPDCSLCCIIGKDIQPAIEPYYQVLFNANPASIGGAIPDEGIYFVQ